MDVRERVVRTFSFEKTDRVARYDIFLPEFAENWRREKQLPGANLYDYYPNIDIGTVLADQDGPLFSRAELLEERDGRQFLRDGWGRVVEQHENAYFEMEVSSVLEKKGTLDSLEFDDPADEERYQGLARHAKANAARFAPVSGVLGLYMGSFRMRGQLQYLMDMAEDPEFCIALAERLGEFIKIQGLKVAEATDTKDTAIWVYDEFSAQRGPMFSAASYEEIFMPVYQKIFRYWRENGIRNIVLHCDGNCAPLMDLLLETGFNGYQSPAPSAGMWLPDLKKKYGKRLVLIGGMCNIHTLATGTHKEIQYEVDAVLDAASDGGVIIGTHSIDKDIPVENYDYYNSLLM